MRPANVLDVAGFTGVAIAALSDSPAWWLAGLMGLGLLLLSEWDSATDKGGAGK